MPGDGGLPRLPLVVLCLSGFGLGLAPAMPGTVASLAVALALWALPTSTLAFVLMTAALVVFGSWATLRFAGALTTEGGHGDPGWVVSDELAGQGLACLGVLPAVVGWPATDAWPAFAAAFVLFRLFDILKPGLVGAMDRKPGGYGVLMDDVVAGVLAGVLTLAGTLAWSMLIG